MAKPQPIKCTYCGSTNLNEKQECQDCGNENRKPLVTGETNLHGDWYSLEKDLEKKEAEYDARPHAPPTEIPENMRVPHHADWYQLAGANPRVALKKPAPPNAHARRLALVVAVSIILLLLGVAGNLLFSIHQLRANGLPHH